MRNSYGYHQPENDSFNGNSEKITITADDIKSRNAAYLSGIRFEILKLRIRIRQDAPLIWERANRGKQAAIASADVGGAALNFWTRYVSDNKTPCESIANGIADDALKQATMRGICAEFDAAKLYPKDDDAGDDFYD